MKHAKLVISIQSQVVYGHVGNSAAVFPMQAVGLEVAPVPTVLLSNTPNHPTIRGRAMPADFFADLLRGVEERGLLEEADFLVTGYIGSPEVASLTADFVQRAKERNPGLIYLCDPVMGDTGTGIYVPEAVTAILRERLLPLADLATPNQFELGFLTGSALTSLDGLTGLAARIGMKPEARIICTGCVIDETPAGRIESLLVTPEGVSRHGSDLLPVAKSGTGDLFTGLVLAGLGRGKALAEAVSYAQELTSHAIKGAERYGTKEVLLSDADFRRALLLS